MKNKTIRNKRETNLLKYFNEYEYNIIWILSKIYKVQQ